MTRADAYKLCSVAGDLSIGEIVDPNHVVSMHFPHLVLDYQAAMLGS